MTTTGNNIHFHVSRSAAFRDAAIVAFLLGYTEFALGWLFVSKGQDVTLAMARLLTGYELSCQPADRLGVTGADLPLAE